MRNLLVGQSLDLLWTCQVSTPTFEEYLQMVDGSKQSYLCPAQVDMCCYLPLIYDILETGALFVMVYRIMIAVSPGQTVVPALERFMLLFGRYFQIRDDYANLASPDVSSNPITVVFYSCLFTNIF